MPQFKLAAAATVVLSTAVTAAVSATAEKDNKQDDNPAAIATEEAIVTHCGVLLSQAHLIYSKSGRVSVYNTSYYEQEALVTIIYWWSLLLIKKFCFVQKG